MNKFFRISRNLEIIFFATDQIWTQPHLLLSVNTSSVPVLYYQHQNETASPIQVNHLLVGFELPVDLLSGGLVIPPAH